MKISKANTILIIVTLLFGGVLFSSVSSPVFAQTAIPSSTPTPNPTISALEDVIATQQVQISTLEREQLWEAKERDIGFRDINSQWKAWLAFVGIAGSVLAIIGIKSVRDLWDTIKKAKKDWQENINGLEKEWEKRSEIALDRAVYKLDMANIPILLPVDENIGSIHNLLQQRKFEKVVYYKNFTDLKDGILVVSLKGKNEDEQKKILDHFKEFIKLCNPSAVNTGFIIYSPDGIKVPSDVLMCHDNLVAANFPSTVVSSIFTVGRGIDISIPKDETKKEDK
jgi:hypothetical protein